MVSEDPRPIMLQLWESRHGDFLVFVRGCPPGTPAHRIAAAAGISRATLYRWLEVKGARFDRVLVTDGEATDLAPVS